jgi:formylglycine-generating enzyme required for sulfatase activity
VRAHHALIVAALVGCQQSSASSDLPENAPKAAASEAPAPAPEPSAPAPAASSAETKPAVAPAPKPEEVPPGMVRIDEGIFLMGADAARGNPEERPAHEAIVPAFYMDITEVTVDAYLKCIAEGGCKETHMDRRFCNARHKDRGDHPITCVDLPMAAAFCKWAGKRLPTEREWEYAASNGKERWRYAWGNLEPTDKNNCWEHPFGSCKVASFPAGGHGLFDMTGNVWEWTQSAFEPYPSHDKPDEIDEKKQWVHKGGSWSRRFSKWMRNMVRNRWKASDYSESLGMRCVKQIEPLVCPAETEAKDGACVRTTGEVLCEQGLKWNGKACTFKGITDERLLGPPKTNQELNPSHIDVPQHEAPASEVAPAITKSRTPQWDADCAAHWPAYPSSYLFKGGDNYHSRRPVLKAHGCTPRDMTGSWTSACCK